MDNYAQPEPRPTFLTVMCILGFLFGAWMLVSGVRTAFTDKPQQDLERARVEIEQTIEDQGEDVPRIMVEILEGTVHMGERTVEQATPIGISGIVLALLSLYGVWQMWNQRKAGFWLYFLASVLGLLSTFYFLGTGMAVIFAVGIMAFFSLILIILFAVNLKHMH